MLFFIDNLCLEETIDIAALVFHVSPNRSCINHQHFRSADLLISTVLSVSGKQRRSPQSPTEDVSSSTTASPDLWRLLVVQSPTSQYKSGVGCPSIDRRRSSIQRPYGYSLCETSDSGYASIQFAAEHQHLCSRKAHNCTKQAPSRHMLSWSYPNQAATTAARNSSGVARSACQPTSNRHTFSTRRCRQIPQSQR